MPVHFVTIKMYYFLDCTVDMCVSILSKMCTRCLTDSTLLLTITYAARSMKIFGSNREKNRSVCQREKIVHLVRKK